MTRIINFLYSLFKKEEHQLPSNFHSKIIPDYLKSNQIEENILSEVIKTDKLRVELITELIERLELHKSTSMKERLSESKTVEEKVVEKDIQEYQRHLDRLNERISAYEKEKSDKVENNDEQSERLRNFIRNHAIDLFSTEMRNEKHKASPIGYWTIINVSNYNYLEKENRKGIIRKHDYFVQRIQVQLELLNVVDEMYKQKINKEEKV